MRWKILVKGLLLGTVLGFLLLGGMSRLMMRVIAILAGQEGEFSAQATLEVLAFGALVGAPSGFLLPLVRRYLPGGRILRGLIFGALTFGPRWF